MKYRIVKVTNDLGSHYLVEKFVVSNCRDEEVYYAVGDKLYSLDEAKASLKIKKALGDKRGMEETREVIYVD